MYLFHARRFVGVLGVMSMASTAVAQGQPDAAQASLQKPAAVLPAPVTDRPDFTESSAVVGKGFVQLEMGTTVEVDRAAGTSHRTVTLPLGLVRVGFGSRAEFRVSSD